MIRYKRLGKLSMKLTNNAKLSNTYKHKSGEFQVENEELEEDKIKQP